MVGRVLMGDGRGVLWCPVVIAKADGSGNVTFVSSVWDAAKTGRVEYKDAGGTRWTVDGAGKAVLA